MSKVIIPLGERVLIEPLDVTRGGIIVSSDSGYLHGVVLAVGKGLACVNNQRMPMEVSVGDIVIYGNVQSTIEDTLNGKVVKLVQHAAIVAIVQG